MRPAGLSGIDIQGCSISEAGPFASAKDYWPKQGKTIDLHRLDQDLTAAVEEIIIDEVADTAGTLHRRTRLRLHDKLTALVSAAWHLGVLPIGRSPKAASSASCCK